MYACSKEISDKDRFYNEVFEEAIKLLLENNRLWPWKRDKDIHLKVKQVIDQIPRGLRGFLDEQASKLGRTFFQKVEYDVIHCRGYKLKQVIRKVKVY